jgi:hypothetical protein
LDENIGRIVEFEFKDDGLWVWIAFEGGEKMELSFAANSWTANAVGERVAEKTHERLKDLLTNEHRPLRIVHSPPDDE